MNRYIENKNYKFNINENKEIELINYVNLSNREKSLTLEMRNHKEINKWMFNRNNILEQEHLAFIENLKNDKSRKYFLVKFEKNIIGSINFSNIIQKKSAELGLYANPLINKRGLGELLNSVSGIYAFQKLNVKKIILKVFSENQRAINFYKKSGFRLLDKKTTCCMNIQYMERDIYMENSNEN